MSHRRTFFHQLAGVVGLAGFFPPAHVLGQNTGSGESQARGLRNQTSFQIRQNAALFQSTQAPATQASNGDETNLPGYIGCFTKGLPHDETNLVEPSAYQSLLHALSTGQYADFEAISRGSGTKLVDPQSAFTYELEGADSHCLACPLAPNFSSAAAADEMVELYWQALARDVPFADYDSTPIIQSAAQDLSRLSSFQGPTQASGGVSSSTIFRINAPGCLVGPYISQFMWKPIPVNSTWVNQLYRVPTAGVDYLENYAEWQVIQSGLPPYRDPTFDPTPRYLSNGRGLAEWVHYDFLYQAFHNAALILMNQAPETILDTNPYWNPTNPYKTSKVETGFATFGAPHVCAWLGRVATAALEAAWYQKWCVHRRLRPEEFGGWAHQTLSGAAAYPISQELLQSAALPLVFKANGAYLLPQAFPEGCPLHPSYPAGHATVAGACSALLKAFFDETGLVTDCVVATSDGLSVTPYQGSALTVGGEVNKLAMNIAIGRNFAGIHYRSDAMAGFSLGEDVAIAMMQDLVATFTEDFVGFQFTRMDGTAVQITREPAMAERPCWGYRPESKP
jgi:membrane-associated phospholipid phosphatase